MNQGETLFLVHNNFSKRECYIKVNDTQGNLSLRYYPGNNRISEKLSNVTKMNYGDQTILKDFCRRDGRMHLTFVLHFGEVPMILECITSEQLIQWFQALRIVISQSFNP